MPRISRKLQVTLPVAVLVNAGLTASDEVTIEADGPDVVVLRRARRDVEAGFGVFDGLYEPGCLEALRAGERA